jgi:ribonuclease PH
LDPTGDEERQSASAMTIAYMPSLNEITQVFQNGPISKEHTQATIDLCLDGCTKLNDIVRDSLQTSITTPIATSTTTEKK